MKLWQKCFKNNKINLNLNKVLYKCRWVSKASNFAISKSYLTSYYLDYYRTIYVCMYIRLVSYYFCYGCPFFFVVSYLWSARLHFANVVLISTAEFFPLIACRSSLSLFVSHLSLCELWLLHRVRERSFIFIRQNRKRALIIRPSRPRPKCEDRFIMLNSEFFYSRPHYSHFNIINLNVCSFRDVLT